MEITGRITADAKVTTLADNREVTGFTIVINDHFKTKSGEKKAVATFIRCSYWVSKKAAEHLKKGAIVTVYGRIGLDVYVNQQNEAQGALTFHVNDIKFIARPANAAPAATVNSATQAVDDLPF